MAVARHLAVVQGGGYIYIYRCEYDEPEALTEGANEAVCLGEGIAK